MVGISILTTVYKTTNITGGHHLVGLLFVGLWHEVCQTTVGWTVRTLWLFRNEFRPIVQGGAPQL